MLCLCVCLGTFALERIGLVEDFYDPPLLGRGREAYIGPIDIVSVQPRDTSDDRKSFKS